MQVQLGKGGNASTAPTLVDLTFEPCAEGAYQLTNQLIPDAAGSEAITRFTIDSDHTVSRDGNVRVLLRVKCKVPLASYNVNGTVVTNVPEFQVHVVLTLPKVVVAALQGTLTTSRDDSFDTSPARDMAMNAVAQAIAVLAAIVSDQPVNYSYMRSHLMGTPFFKGVMGVCPVNYATADFGRGRILPPPERS